MQLFMLPLGGAFSCEQICADDHLSASPDRKIQKIASQQSSLVTDLNSDSLSFFHGLLNSRIEMPPQSRVSRSRQQLRQVRLFGGDHFVAECLDWGSKSVTFRLLNGHTFQLPCQSIAALQNPPGENDLIDESPDEKRSADESRSQNDGSSSAKYQHDFSPPCYARVELTFEVKIADPSSSCGEWQLDWNQEQVKQAPITVTIGPNRSVNVSGLSSADGATTQSLTIKDGSHSFIALFTQDRIRLLLDDASLASVAPKNAILKSLQIRPPEMSPSNVLRIDDIQVKRLDMSEPRGSFREAPRDSDRIKLWSGDELFGQLIGLNRQNVVVESFGGQQVLPWREITELNLRQPAIPISQAFPPKTGIVAEIEMQRFVDRIECDPEHWTVTVLRVDANQIHVQHSLAGDMSIRWCEIRRLDPLFFGQMMLLEARHIHLGNAIRTDLHCPIPTGTDLQRNFHIKEIPKGKPFLSFDLAELEAGSPDAPPASPFLADIRGGHLVTELFVNDQNIGALNTLVRYKASSVHPDRVRMEIPPDLLKPGNNSFRLRQQPLKQGGREYDDCELGNIRLEFEIQ